MIERCKGNKKIYCSTSSVNVFLPVYPAFAVEKRVSPNDLLEVSFEFDDEIIFYRYKKENGKIVYAEAGDDVIERSDNHILVNGTIVATYSEKLVYTARTDDLIPHSNPSCSRSGWMWTTSGNVKDYSTSVYSVREQNISLTQTLSAIAIGTLATILLIFIPLSATATHVATAVIAGLTAGYGACASSKNLCCREYTYKHKYIGISYAKMASRCSMMIQTT